MDARYGFPPASRDRAVRRLWTFGTILQVDGRESLQRDLGRGDEHAVLIGGNICGVHIVRREAISVAFI